MKQIIEHVAVASTWRTIALLVAVAVALLASPDAPVPLLGLYGLLVLFAVLIPVRSVSNLALIRLLGVVTVGLGVWLAVSPVGSSLASGAYVVLGLVAIAIATVVARRRRPESQK